MNFNITVHVEVERLEGKFASRDDIEQEIFTALNDANPSQFDGLGADGVSVYEITDWTVST